MRPRHPDDDHLPSPRHHRPVGMAPAGRATALTGLVLAVAAAAPLVGWAVAWPSLASYLPGWPVTAPGVALALIACGVGLAAQSPGVPRLVRRALAAGGGWTAIVLAVALRLRAAGRPPVLDPAFLVESWHGVPGAALQYWPSRAAAVAITLLGAAVGLLAAERPGMQRAAWGSAAAAALLALASGGMPSAPPIAADMIQAVHAAAEARAVVISPPVALLILLGASGVLLRRSDGGGAGWITARGGAADVARRLLPAVLLLPPALVWSTALAEQREWLTTESARALLTLGLVGGIGAASALAIRHLVRTAERGREHEERRRKRARERVTEDAARAAEGTLLAAADRYRSHLRAILDVAPAPFLALDRQGLVAYANAAALETIGRSAAEASGRPLAELWPEVADAVRVTVAGALNGAPLARTVTAMDGRSLELRGYPSEDGMALFVRELQARR